MDTVVIVVFVLVYLGMFLGELPGLALDRTGVALLGAIVLIATGRVSPERAWQAIDVTTIGLLFGLMIVSAQFRLGGFYGRFTGWLARLAVRPTVLLGLVVLSSAVLSAVLANDIVCLAMAPVLVDGCARRRLDPVPFLLALACASNVGSAATLIGNPQNMLIGQALGLSFGAYLWQATPPTVLGLVLVWGIVHRAVGGRWARETPLPSIERVPFDAWQTGKGAVIVVALMAAFVAGAWPRDIVALAAAGLILTSRRMASRRFLGLVDWNLLLLFAGLFVVNDALAQSGLLEQVTGSVRAAGLDPTRPGWLFALSVVLSNLVSNVPATMLLLPLATHPLAGAVLALASTFAGNLLIVGSIANLIVVDQAGRAGVRIDWRTHARVGVPVTLATLGVAAVWLAFLLG